MNRTHWKLHFDCSRKDSAKKVLNRAIVQLGRPPLEITLDHHHGGGFTATFQISHRYEASYAEVVVEGIHFGQKLGGGWLITGDIQEGISAVLSCSTGARSSVSGLDWAEWQFGHNNKENKAEMATPNQPSD